MIRRQVCLAQCHAPSPVSKAPLKTSKQTRLPIFALRSEQQLRVILEDCSSYVFLFNDSSGIKCNSVSECIYAKQLLKNTTSELGDGRYTALE